MLYFDEDLKDFVFLGDNIPNQIESISEKFDEVQTNNMPEDVKDGYRLGVKTVISLLKQYLDDVLEVYGVVFYRPDIQNGEEMSLEEVQEWVSNREETKWRK